VPTAFLLGRSCTMMPASNSPLADFTTRCGPPVKRVGSAFAVVLANENAHPRIASNRAAPRALVAMIVLLMNFSSSVVLFCTHEPTCPPLQAEEGTRRPQCVR